MSEARDFHELREYRLRREAADNYLRRFSDDVVPRLLSCGFDLRGTWLTEDDEATTLVWLTAWRDQAERDAAFARLVGTPGWADYREAVAPMLIEARSRFMSVVDLVSR